MGLASFCLSVGDPVNVASLSLTWAATVAVLTPAMAAETALGG